MIASNPWELYYSFFSSSKAQSYLYRCYERAGIEQAESKSYQNCYPFIYFIEHGKKYYDLASISPAEIQPVLLFYGMIQLIKACVLTTDPDYPENSSVLAHGLTTRKRKKKCYEFLHDEVKVQRNGLFNHFSYQLFHVKHTEGEKFKMLSLLQYIPELQNRLQEIQQKQQLLQVIQDQHDWHIPSCILTTLHMNTERFLTYINQGSSSSFQLKNETKSHIVLSTSSILTPFSSQPFIWSSDNTYYISRSRPEESFYGALNEPMIHYSILYNLSMLCRYETEWWSDIFHSYTTNDLPFILSFLQTTQRKIPEWFGRYLLSLT
ncbi:hypothetical protein A374_18689 [Fictibacillus macauensis ZFHKF-1]|uniref:YaaC n=1 Tax=Fictibacillus macauensis ZFHKF-1 TaxID=1196324 RepID=I8IWE7_9BACL|nr:YaaC family protein [Fictibacillus macauensis]EIT83806.1 hypothetical protein A374_18689 [Fictibacillus macauensis ZFHKF-1]